MLRKMKSYGHMLTIIQAAMAENLAKSDNNPNEDLNQAYKLWSEGGWGMIMTGELASSQLQMRREKKKSGDLSK